MESLLSIWISVDEPRSELRWVHRILIGHYWESLELYFRPYRMEWILILDNQMVESLATSRKPQLKYSLSPFLRTCCVWLSLCKIYCWRNTKKSCSWSQDSVRRSVMKWWNISSIGSSGAGTIAPRSLEAWLLLFWGSLCDGPPFCDSYTCHSFSVRIQMFRRRCWRTSMRKGWTTWKSHWLIIIRRRLRYVEKRLELL